MCDCGAAWHFAITLRPRVPKYILAAGPDHRVHSAAIVGRMAGLARLLLTVCA
jgi:hypothetical protein